MRTAILESTEETHHASLIVCRPNWMFFLQALPCLSAVVDTSRNAAALLSLAEHMRLQTAWYQIKFCISMRLTDFGLITRDDDITLQGFKK